MYRMYEMPMTKKPTADCRVVVVDSEGFMFAMDYTVEGGWNTFRNADGIVFTENAINAETCSAFKFWLKKVFINGEDWYDTLAVISEEADKLRQQYESEGRCDDKVDALDEMLDHLAQAMEFAEEFTW